MPSQLTEFKFEHLSVGSTLQNLAFYSLVVFMLLVIIVQTNAHNETGIRKYILTHVTGFADSVTGVSHHLYFKVRQLFVSRG